MFSRPAKVGVVAGTCVAAASIFLASGASARAAGILDQVPANARMCMVMNNLAAVDHKIKALEGKMNLPVTNDPLSMMEQSMGIGAGLDEHGSAGVVFLQPTLGHRHPMVVLFPIAHLHAAFAADSLSKADARGIHTISAPDGSPGYVARHGAFAVLAQHRSALQAYLAAGAWGMKGLSPADAKSIGAADLACYVNLPTVRKQIVAKLNGVLPGMMVQVRHRVGKSNSGTITMLTLDMEFRALKQVIRESHAVLFTANIMPSGLALKVALDAEPGSAVATLIAGQPQLPGNPLVGLPGGRFLAAGAMMTNGKPLAGWLEKLVAKAVQDPAIDRLSGMAKAQQQIQTNLATLAAAGNVVTAFDLMAPAGAKDALMHGVLVQQTSGSAAAALAANMTNLERMYGSTGMTLPNGNISVKLQPNAFVLDGVNFDRMIMHVYPALPQSPMVQSTIAAIYGRHGTKIDLGAVNKTDLVGGINTSRGELANAVTAVRMRQDVLDGQPEITAQAAHVLPHPQIVAYLPLDSWVRLAMARMSAANAGAAPAQAGAAPAGPMTMSVGTRGSQVAGQLFIPTAQLTALAADGRALMMMVMMSMMNGQQPPPPPDAPGQQGQ
ncbi:MAG: hypothetical protein HKL95_07750 [Phycisphaerae bacterium]|nr:hypothetical protein [Phycisphaerae bacterium]